MKKGLQIPVVIFALLLFLVMMQSCVVATKDTIITPQIRDLFKGTYAVDPFMESHKPNTVAILPFYNQAQSQRGAEEVRKGFYNHFSSLPYKNIKLYSVDNILRKAGLTDAEAINKTSPKDLGRILGVDAVIYGSISDFDKLFAVIYSSVSVGAEIKMYDTKTGNFLWSGKHVARIQEGVIATNPVGLIAGVVATAMNVRDIQLLRACDDLFREMVKTIPVPTIAEALRPPSITLLTQDTKNLPKKAGDEIKVVILGASKMQAYFDIGEFKKNIDMQEIEPGGYMGVYKVVPGDNVANAVITGYLRDETGNTAQWVDAVGTVTIDTMPPERVKGISTVGRNLTVMLNWEKSSAADLAGYRIYRSTTPLSGFQQIAKSELNEYRDDKLVNTQKYYYQITAVDWAGNESQRSEAQRGMPIAPGPTPVSGIIESDEIWYAGASPYIIEKAVIVKDKATLTIEPGTEIRSKGSALVIEGRLNAQGDEGHIITFDKAEDGKEWEGVIFSNVKEKANIIKFGRIRNAIAGITCRASSPLIESCELLENRTALKISGAFSKPQVMKNTIQKNREGAVIIGDGAQPQLVQNNIQENMKEGISIQSSAPVITHNRITGNHGSGITVKNSHSIITENNIHDNKPFDMVGNMAGGAANAVNNWWGSAKGLEILSRMQGRINIKSVLNAPYPEGKPFELPILSQTLEGLITADSYLALFHSPYRVKKDVIIDRGSTLYIEPGVVIQYDQDTSLITEDGGIMAKGTKEQPIVFTASGTSPSPGFYTNAVRFQKRTKVNSAFAHCIVKYAATAFNVQYGAPEISYCYIAKNAQAGVYCQNDAAPMISYSTFMENYGEGGIVARGQSRPKINFSNFIKNDTHIQAFSTIRIDATNNWWGKALPSERDMLKDSNDSLNITPWLKVPEANAYTEK